MKKLVALLISLACLSGARAQESGQRFSVGLQIRYVPIADKRYTYPDRVRSDLNSKRNDFAIDCSYMLTSRLGMASAAGVSLYNADVDFYGERALSYTGSSISTVDLLLSHRVFWRINLFPFGASGDHSPRDFRIRLSPFAGLKYYQPLEKPRTQDGFADLGSAEASDWIRQQDLPAVSVNKKSHTGQLLLAPGLSLEVSLGRHIGLFYDFSYNLSLAGRTRIDLDYRYKGDVERRSYKDPKAFMEHTFGVHYCF